MPKEYPDRPLLGVGSVIVSDGKVVLIRRGSDPDYGLWSIPGGLVEEGESLREAVARETLEETGIVVEVKEPLEILDRIVYDEGGQVKYHFVIIDYRADPIEGVLKESSDAIEARYVKLEDLKNYEITETVKNLLRSVGLMRD
ncbi:MAG: NUDIX hydrolase [Candidatus Jordarchaeum sp.]|uniref:NUDIX hydrolase n=1 Tax=Candidatus Jordarchaeum sp. TaxID=2823881 RepID=UPI00404A25E4